LIKSKTIDIIKFDFAFRSYQYATVWMRIFMNKSLIEEVANIDCVMSLIDVRYLTITISFAKIIKMNAAINVRDIDNVLHECEFYVMLNFYLDDLFNDRKMRNHMHREFHIMNDLKCKLLMRLDIMTSEQMIINLIDKSLFISMCDDLIVSIRINSKSNSRITRVVHSKISIIIFLNSVTSISIYMRDKKLSLNRDFLFESNHEKLSFSLEIMRDLYTHVCNCNMNFVHVRNDLFTTMIVSSRIRLDVFIEYEEESCFQINLAYHEWVVVLDENLKNFHRVVCEI
jgi:hypothetical protein